MRIRFRIRIPNNGFKISFPFLDQTGLDETELELFLTSLDFIAGLKNQDLLAQVTAVQGGGAGMVEGEGRGGGLAGACFLLPWTLSRVSRIRISWLR
jgi:hypothetical protein